jgi:dihydrofolate reductase
MVDFRATKYMKVLLLAALTADGKLARDAHELTSWTSRADKRLFARTSREAGVVIMGHHTFETLPAPLPGRLHVVLSRQPAAAHPEQIEYTDESPERLVARLAGRGYATAVLGGGAQTFRAFLAARAVDELWLTVEPRTFGRGITLLGDEPLALRLHLLECRRLGTDSVLLRYEPQWPAAR